MQKRERVAFDFESEGIQPFPDYPPKPTMLGIYEEGKTPLYMAWGHPSGNNSSEGRARAVLKAFWDNPNVELIAQNIAFDMAIAVKHWGLSLYRKGVNHDTMVQAFLLEPHAMTFALKPMAERHLGLPPEEQDSVRDWLTANGEVRTNQKDWGAYISLCPADVVGPYCIGDVERTMQLFKLFEKQIEEKEMTAAYRRELKLIPIMLENTLAGVRVDVKMLKTHVEVYAKALADVEALLFKELGSADFNVNSDEELANAIDTAHPGLTWAVTKTGKRSTSKANITATLEGVTGKLGAILQYRASIATCLNTFMRPWLIQARAGDGRMRCQWNTTRSDTAGARTGRLSSTPSLMNIPTLASAKFKQAIDLRAEWLPEFPELPNVRSYLLADKGDVLVSFDFSAQELRTLAHYEDGILLQAYKDDPTQDLHQYAADLISSQIGKPFKRKQAKTCAFAILYGSGLATLAQQLGSSVTEAQEIKGAYLAALPGVAELIKSLKARAKINLPIRTWGGRMYYVEPPKMMEGRLRTFDYKLLNYLCQGSAADLTKEALIRYTGAKEHGKLTVTVHDQIVISVPKKHWKSEAKILRECMEGLELDAKLLADGSMGPDLHNLKDFKDV